MDRVPAPQGMGGIAELWEPCPELHHQQTLGLRARSGTSRNDGPTFPAGLRREGFLEEEVEEWAFKEEQEFAGQRDGNF